MGRIYNAIPLTACGKIIKEADENNNIRVSNAAEKELSDILLARAESISRKAIDIARNAGRKTVLDKDIELASKQEVLR